MPQSNFFKIFFLGKLLDIDALTISTSLTFNYSWRRGELVRDAWDDTARHTNSGVEIILGDGVKTSLRDQQAIADNYITIYKSDLIYISQFPGVTNAVFGLQYVRLLSEGMTGFSLSVPADLTRKAQDIGLRLVIYFMFELRMEKLEC